MPYVGGTVAAVLPAAAPRPPARRGACPGVFDPMESADGWLVRVRLPGGRITVDQLGVVAHLADRVGSGTVELTSRANMQLRGVTEAALDAVGRELLDAGLAAPDAAADARRAVVASPLAGHDPTELVDVTELVDGMLDALGGADLPQLPTKFGIVIDGGGRLSVRDVRATIALGATVGDGDAVHWHASTGTSLSAGPSVDLGRADPVALIEYVLQAARGCAPPYAPARATARPAEQGPAVGVLAHTATDRVSVVAEAFLGRTTAATLRAIADLGGIALAVRVVPGGVALLGVPGSCTPMLIEALRDLAFVVDGDDRRAGISACIGAPGCASARADTAAGARDLIASGPRTRVHLAACEKCCGAPLGADVLVADAGGRFPGLGTRMLASAGQP